MLPNDKQDADRIESIFHEFFANDRNLRFWKSDLQDALRTGRDVQVARIAGRETVEAVGVPRLTAHFMGRDDERDMIARTVMLGGSSAILIQGGPGMGKTELTKAVAQHPDVAARFGKRRYFVALETASSAAAMQDAIIRALGCNPKDGFEAALNTLCGAQSFLILDNLETPWERCEERQATEKALSQLSSVATVIASFRGRDKMRAMRWTLEPMLHPFAAIESTVLFAAIAGEWVLNDPGLDRFVEALGGIPLAVDLVARRAYSFTRLAPLWEEWIRIGDELAKDPDFAEDRLTSLPRSIELSIRSTRMTDPAHLLFQLLGYLPAGIADEDCAKLLRDHAFDAGERLYRTGLAVDRGMRLDLLPPIREHARRHYPLAPIEADRCSDHFLPKLVEMQSGFVSDRSQLLIKQNAPCFANFEVCLVHSLNIANETSLRSEINGLGALASQALVQTNIFDRLASTLAQKGDFGSAALCLRICGDLAHSRSDYEVATRYFLQSTERYEIVDDLSGRGACLQRLGDIALRQANIVLARSYVEEATFLYISVQDTVGEATTLRTLGDILSQTGDYQSAFDSYMGAGERHERIGNEWGVADCMLSLGYLAVRMENDDTARQAFEQALSLYQPLGVPVSQASCLRGLAMIQINQNEHQTANDLYSQALAISLEAGDANGVAQAHLGLGENALAQSDCAVSLHHYKKAENIFLSVRNVLGLGRCEIGFGRISFAELRFDDAKAFFRSASQIFDDALEQLNRAYCYERIGEVDAYLCSNGVAAHCQQAIQSFAKARDLYRSLGRFKLEERCVHEIERLSERLPTSENPLV